MYWQVLARTIPLSMFDIVNERVSRWVRALTSGIRFGKFVSVGAVGAVFDLAVTVLLVELFGVLEEVGVLVGIEVSILVMFALNEHWTFPDAGGEGMRALLGRLGRSHLVRSGAVLVQLVVFVVIYRLFFVSLTVAGVDIWVLVGKGAGIALGTVLNYVLESLFTWQIQST